MEIELIKADYSGISELFKYFFVRLAIDLFFVIILLKLIYLKRYKNNDLGFTFIAFNVVMFCVSFLLNRVDLSLGAAFGLFAVFGMLRYKTEEISIKDMTYLFINIGIGLITAVTQVKNAGFALELGFIIALNFAILAIIFVLENNLIMKRELNQVIQYEKIENIVPEKRAELIADLKTRTGLNIHHVLIQKTDFLKDSAQIKIYYYE
jgi:hypothetical protein